MGYRVDYTSGYYGTEDVAVFVPRDRRSDIPVICFHGGYSSATQFAHETPVMIPYLCSTYGGLVCFSGDMGGANTWGNDTMLASMDALLTWAATNYGTRTDKVALVGLSHGGSSLNWAWRNPDAVAAWLGILPGTNMQSLYERDPLGITAASMVTAYGSEAAVIAAYPDRDPAHANNTPLQAVFADRIAVWYGADDTVGLPGEIAQWATDVGVTEAHEMAGVGHDFDFDWQPLADWLVPTVRHTA